MKESLCVKVSDRCGVDFSISVRVFRAQCQPVDNCPSKVGMTGTDPLSRRMIKVRPFRIGEPIFLAYATPTESVFGS